MKIEEILRNKGHEVVTITEKETVLDAVGLLVQRNIGAVVVTEGDRPSGILTERDVLRLTASAPGRLDLITVQSVMTRDVVTASPHDDLTDMMDVMTRNKVRHLPVIVGEELVGIVSIGDLVHHCLIAAEQENSHLREYIQGVG